MTVNNHPLPALFLEIYADILSGGLSDWWEQKGEVDSYGHSWQACLRIENHIGSIEWQTSQLAKEYLPENNTDELSFPKPGFIPWITDFSQIVYFGERGNGAPFCFDFRDNPEEPSIIEWADAAHWRRVAPSFETFILLFEPQWERLSATWKSLQRRSSTGKKPKKGAVKNEFQPPDRKAYEVWCGSGRVVDAIVEVLTVAKSALGPGATIDQVIDLVRHQMPLYQSIIEDAVADPK